MNQGKLLLIKQEMEHLNIAVLGVSELKWTGMEYLQSQNYKGFYLGNGKLRGREVAEIRCNTGSQGLQGQTELYPSDF